MRFSFLAILLAGFSTVSQAATTPKSLYYNCTSAAGSKNFIRTLSIRLDGSSNALRTGRLENFIGYGELSLLGTIPAKDKKDRKVIYDLDWGTDKPENYYLTAPSPLKKKISIETLRYADDEETGRWAYDCEQVKYVPKVAEKTITSVKRYFERQESPFSPSGTYVSPRARRAALSNLASKDAWKEHNYLRRTHDEFKPKVFTLNADGTPIIAITVNADVLSELYVYDENGNFIAEATATAQSPTLTWAKF